jgi:UTP--glucose-1-phosphate uridylyltransferase
MTSSVPPEAILGLIPAAGIGSRMAAVTGGNSKELLRVSSRTLLDWNLDEARESGCEDTLVISSAQKIDLLAALDDRGTARVNQDNATGLAHAVALAGTQNPRLILLPDTVFYPGHPSRRIMSALSGGADVVMAVGLVPAESVHRYGIVTWDEASGEIESIVEKPRPEDTPSRWAISGRFGLSRAALMRLPDLIAGWKEPGEVHLPPLLNLAIQDGLRGVAIPLHDDECRFDCGSVEGYREALAVLGE